MRWLLGLGLLWACKGKEADDRPGLTDPAAVIVPTFDPYEPIRLIEPYEEYPFEGYGTLSWVPEKPDALVFVFHGTNGGINTITQPEWRALYRDLQVRNIGFVGTISTDREQQVWDLSVSNSDNADWPWLQALHQHLVDTTCVTEDTPLIALGFSNGGKMAPVFADYILALGGPMKAFVSHAGANGHQPGIPGLYVATENDDTSADADELKESKRACSAKGPECKFMKLDELDIPDNFFARLPDYNEEDSARIVEELVERQILDDLGKRLIDIADAEDVFSGFEATTLVNSPSLVSGQLRVGFAMHRFNALSIAEEADWLLEQIAP